MCAAEWGESERNALPNHILSGPSFCPLYFFGGGGFSPRGLALTLALWVFLGGFKCLLGADIFVPNHFVRSVLNSNVGFTA